MQFDDSLNSVKAFSCLLRGTLLIVLRFMMLLIYLIGTCGALCIAQANEVEYEKTLTSTYDDDDSNLTEIVLHEDEELYDLPELKEKNMCIHVEKVKEVIVKPVTIPVEENVTYWCFNIPPKCTKT
ncbi:uncharacterized protein LOC118201432, partial [Stegodyphus dumicola]|uniref:uncharacterized protein LOC118201432 n=1 Tax=Stegodyphus dumicola TaxID=202533 RepID=UPI0015B28EE3